jgi:hypothetical protein
MHNIDRTQQEMGWNGQHEDRGEFEFDDSEYEIYGELYDEAYDETDGEFEFEFEFEGPLDEAEEMELAAELLEITDEEELDQFIGKMFKKIGKKVGKVIPKAIRKPLGGMLKGVGRKLLPIAGAALGNLAVPGLGGMVGGRLASMAGQALGLELEGLSPEDQEFEIARGYVRLASDAAENAAMAPHNAPPAAVAKGALALASQKHAPGLVGKQRNRQNKNGRGSSGTWERRGSSVILHGLFRT